MRINSQNTLRMKNEKLIRHTAIGILLFLGAWWSLSVAAQEQKAEDAAWPNDHLIATADWLQKHINNPDIRIVDVRTDEHFDGELIPGAIRLPWNSFRHNNAALHVGSVFVGVEEAQNILGAHGIQPSDTVLLYDSVERDGGATASYVFWVMEMLGHKEIKVLDGGIDAWRETGDVDTAPAEPKPVLYQADPQSIHPRLWANGDYIEKRLGDPYYQLIDVRSSGEYLGEVGNKDLSGNPLKLGHIPTAFNIPYNAAWIDEETKRIKPYNELQELYRGINPDKAVIVYCHSGRRSSFSYFILRLMGFNDVIEYEGSWNEWGSPRNFFPVELHENKPASDALPGAEGGSPMMKSGSRSTVTQPTKPDSGTASGYVSCGG